jgi:hypothetical protein
MSWEEVVRHLHLQRDPREVDAAAREAGARSDQAQIKGEPDLFWQQLAIEEAISQAHLPLDRCLGSAIGALWRCGLLDRLPETEQELVEIGVSLRAACKTMPVRPGGVS